MLPTAALSRSDQPPVDWIGSHEAADHGGLHHESELDHVGLELGPKKGAEQVEVGEGHEPDMPTYHAVSDSVSALRSPPKSHRQGRGFEPSKLPVWLMFSQTRVHRDGLANSVSRLVFWSKRHHGKMFTQTEFLNLRLSTQLTDLCTRRPSTKATRAVGLRTNGGRCCVTQLWRWLMFWCSPRSAFYQ